MKRLLQLNPDNRPATWKQIRDRGAQLEQLPISTPLGSFAATSDAVEELQDALEVFDDLPTLNPDGTLPWELADGSPVDLTKAQVQTLIQEIRRRRAIRRARLKEKAKTFRQMATLPTPEQLSDLAFWLEE